MPTKHRELRSSQLRSSPITKPATKFEKTKGRQTQTTPKKSKTKQEDSSSDDDDDDDSRQYMMLRHSPDSTNNDNNNIKQEEEGSEVGGGVLPNAVSKEDPSPERGATTLRSLRGPRPTAADALSAAANANTPSTASSRQVSIQQPPMPFRVGGSTPPENRPQANYLRGVSEDPSQYQHPHQPPAVHTTHSPYHHAAHLPPGASREELSIGFAPSWGSIDFRMGTFDYGDAHGLGEPIELSVAAGLAGYSPAVPAAQYADQNVITPAQTLRKQQQQYGASGHNAGAAPQVVHAPPQPTSQHQYMYPPSSPIKASPKPSPQASPKVEGVKEEEIGTNSDHEEEGGEELNAEWLPPREGQGRKNQLVATVHVPPKCPTEAPHHPFTRQPQFIRRPQQLPLTNLTTVTPTTVYRQHPHQLALDTSRSHSNDSSESPERSLLTAGGRVQVVGGGKHEWDAHPWSIVSRSRSAESHGSGPTSAQHQHYHQGSSAEWEPPRPNRTPMVPTPGRPGTTGASAAATTEEYGQDNNSMRPPPPPSHSSYYPGWEHHRKAPPQHNQYSSRGGSGRGYAPYSPERVPPHHTPSSYYHQNHHPEYYPGYPPSAYYHHPSHRHPHQSSYSSQQHVSSYTGGHHGLPSHPAVKAEDEQPQDYNTEAPPHPLLKNYNPHMDADGNIVIRPQFQNTKKSKAAKKRNAAAMKAAADADGTCLAGDGGDPTPRRRRRRNPSEKAAAAAAMAAAAAADLKERKENEVKKAAEAAAGGSDVVKQEEEDEAGEEEGNHDAPTAPQSSSTIVGVLKGGAVLGPISEEELKTLGSGDDEDIPAAKRAAMASALALRAAAGGSPVPPPKSSSEVDFDVANPPESPVILPSELPVLESTTLMAENDVLCGRGGGTNSQMGNRHFRALVRDFQPTYLMAKRREKPKMARSVVVIIRNRGGRFLRRDDKTGRLYEVGDEKAEAKTSQALREGLDVRATRTAADTLMGTEKYTKKRKNNVPPTVSNHAPPPPTGNSPTTHATPRPSRPPPPPPGYYHPQYHDPYHRSRPYHPGQCHPPSASYHPEVHPATYPPHHYTSSFSSPRPRGPQFKQHQSTSASSMPVVSRPPKLHP